MHAYTAASIANKAPTQPSSALSTGHRFFVFIHGWNNWQNARGRERCRPTEPVSGSMETERTRGAGDGGERQRIIEANNVLVV